MATVSMMIAPKAQAKVPALAQPSAAQRASSPGLAFWPFLASVRSLQPARHDEPDAV